MCALSRVWFLAIPLTVALQAPLSLGLSRQGYWSGLACPSPGDLPDPGTKPTSLASPVLAGRFFTTSTFWEATPSATINFFFFFFRKWEKSQRGGVVRIVTGRACFSLSNTLFSQGRQANNPRRRKLDTWHRAYTVGSSQPPPGACVWERTGQKTHTSSPHHSRVSQGPEAAQRVGLGQSDPQARTGTQAQAGGSSRGWVGPEVSVQTPRALCGSWGPKSTATDTEGHGVRFQEVV